MSADSQPTLPEIPSERPGPPRLRVHHLLVWMAVAAVSFSFYRLFLVQGTPDWWIDSLSGYAGALSMSVIGLMIQAAGITLFLYAVWWRWKGFDVFREPGEWLLCVFPYSIVDPAINHLVFPALFTSLFNEQPWHHVRLIWELRDIARAFFWTATFILQLGVPVGFFGWCAWRNADTRAWRLLFAAFCVGLLAWLLVMFLTFESMNRTASGFAVAVYYYVPSYVAAILATTVIANDFYTVRRRSWVHWAGASLFALSQWWAVFTSLVWWWIQ